MGSHLKITYIGGPTTLLEFGGLRLLTDPTFDAPGQDYRNGPVTLHKLAGPALTPADLGNIDFVLLSHDHHYDNLDHAGRLLLKNVKQVLTTEEGAQRLEGNAIGLKDWESVDLTAPDGRVLRVIATPARHGPAGIDRGAVHGFVLMLRNKPSESIYISGDTVWYDGVAEVARRFSIRAALLHLGAATVPEVGSFHLTMTALEAVEAARAFPQAAIIPIHYEGWQHFSEGEEEIVLEFATAGLDHRLQWPKPGQALELDLSDLGFDTQYLHSTSAAR